MSNRLLPWLDREALARFRIALAILVLADLAIRWMDREAHYSTSGVLPPPLWWGDHSAPGVWSIHVLLPDSALPWAFGGAAAAGTALLLGYKTGLAAAATWALTVSLQARNPEVCHSGDDALAALLFWAMLLPLGSRRSIDARRAPAADPGQPAVGSYATAGLLLQWVVLYGASSWYKVEQPVWSDHSAVGLALANEVYATAFGAWLGRQSSLVSTIATPVSLLLEVGLATGLLASVRWPRWRGPIAIAGIAFHLGLAATLRIGIFPATMIVGWLAFLPGRTPSQTPQDRSFTLRDAIAASAVMLMVTINLLGAADVPAPRAVAATASALHLDQSWHMFDAPPAVARHPRAVATLSDGSHVDLLEEMDLWPAPNARWRTFLDSAHFADPAPLTAHLCRTWSRENPERRASAIGLVIEHRDLLQDSAGDAAPDAWTVERPTTPCPDSISAGPSPHAAQTRSTA